MRGDAGTDVACQARLERKASSHCMLCTCFHRTHIDLEAW